MKPIEHTFVVLAYKESQYLEECIQSVLNQAFPSKVIIGTSTRNEYIENMADKYNLNIVENEIKGGGNAVDFDFAWNAGDTELVTIAHQDDTYDPTYSLRMVEAYKKHPDATIIFTDYYEIRDGKKLYENRNLNIKRLLLTPLRWREWADQRHVKRSVLSLGNSICCPAVTFCKKNIPYRSIFVNKEVGGNSDWAGWLKLAETKGRFVFVEEALMGHRVHEETHTSRDINAHIRSPQDLVMLEKFWPKPIAEVINHFYAKSEESNKL